MKSTASPQSDAPPTGDADSHEDTPVLPVSQLERLHSLSPDLVDWVFQQTEIEARRRRQLWQQNLMEESRARMAFVAVSLVAIVGSLTVGTFLALRDAQLAGGLVGGLGAVAPLAAAAITRLWVRIHRQASDDKGDVE